MRNAVIILFCLAAEIACAQFIRYPNDQNYLRQDFKSHNVMHMHMGISDYYFDTLGRQSMQIFSYAYGKRIRSYRGLSASHDTITWKYGANDSVAEYRKVTSDTSFITKDSLEYLRRENITTYTYTNANTCYVKTWRYEKTYTEDSILYTISNTIKYKYIYTGHDSVTIRKKIYDTSAAIVVDSTITGKFRKRNFRYTLQDSANYPELFADYRFQSKTDLNYEITYYDKNNNLMALTSITYTYTFRYDSLNRMIFWGESGYSPYYISPYKNSPFENTLYNKTYLTYDGAKKIKLREYKDKAYTSRNMYAKVKKDSMLLKKLDQYNTFYPNGLIKDITFTSKLTRHSTQRKYVDFFKGRKRKEKMQITYEYFKPWSNLE